MEHSPLGWFYSLEVRFFGRMLTPTSPSLMCSEVEVEFFTARPNPLGVAAWQITREPLPQPLVMREEDQ